MFSEKEVKRFSKKYKVRIWWFSRGNSIPLQKSDIITLSADELLSYFDSSLIDITSAAQGDYFVIKKYAQYYI